MLLFWLGSCHVIPAPKYVGQSGTCGCDEMLHLRLFKPKWLTFTSIFIRFPAHFSNKCISISKHEHSMVIHIASLMRVNLHNTGKYPQNTYNYWQINNPFQLSSNKPRRRQKWKWVIRHQPRHQWSAIFINVWGMGVTSRTLFWVHVYIYIQNVFRSTFQIGWENAPKTAPGVLGP